MYTSTDLVTAGIAGRMQLQRWSERELLARTVKHHVGFFSSTDALMAGCMSKLRECCSVQQISAQAENLRSLIARKPKFIVAHTHASEGSYKGKDYVQIVGLDAFRSPARIISSLNRSKGGMIVIDVDELRKRIASIGAREKAMSTAAAA